MGRKIDFVNPFGSRLYDDLIHKTLSHYAGEGTELTISHLDGFTTEIDYFYSKHLMEAVLFEHVMQAEEKGFDAVIVGCCYDPGVRIARELVSIPVIGPMEASLQMANYHGYNYTVVTDHHKAAPWIEDVIKLSGLNGNYQGIRTIEWYVRDMVNDPDAVALDTIKRCEEVVGETHVDTIIMGCTIVAACFQQWLMKGNTPPKFAIMNPNLMALKMAESLADLKQKNGYHISRAGFYEQPSGFYAEEFRRARTGFAKAVANLKTRKHATE